MIPVLWLCGPPGVGKTAVAWEIYERLDRAGSAPAYVDVDQLGMCYPPPASDPERHMLKARNVAALRETSQLPVPAVWSFRVSSMPAGGRRLACSAVHRSQSAGCVLIPPNFVCGSIGVRHPCPA